MEDASHHENPRSASPPAGADAAPCVSVTKVALPAGGGALRGLGETVEAHEATGTAALSIPLPVSPCRGAEPELALAYGSGDGNGVAGLGFQLSLSSVTRRTSRGVPRYDGTDTFLLDGMDLVPDAGAARIAMRGETRYRVKAFRPRFEQGFDAVERWASASGTSFWRILDAGGTTRLYGPDDASRIADPEAPTRIFAWLLAETVDA